ncbi:ABC transporter ATP-binding protein [uncultured Ruminococcus sp.]|uniref:ABC transporter ATP-binding protein n=1 Tax=uncultured Ruminococcus sp. TaxID=165186 RepID=UPI0025962E2C|nr:ABC transporter ATP-binding protein [uncultured Ruminococcus sp.]
MRKYEKASKGEMASAMKKIIEYMKGSVGIVAVALVLAALGAVLTIIGPDKVGEITDLMADGLMTGIDLKAVARVGIFLGAIYISSSLFTFIQQYIMATVTLKMSYRMRSDLSRKINCVPQKYFNSHSQGDILSRITNDVSTLQQGLTNSLPTIISAAAQFVGCLIMMFVTEWRLALISLFITFFGLFLIVFIMSKSQKFFLDRQESLGKLNGYVEEMYSGHEVVRISRGAGNVKKHFGGLNEAVYNANWKSQFLSGIMQPLMNVIGNLAYVAVCVFGSMLALNGTITFGVIISFILYVRLFTSPLGQIAQGMTNMQTASASAQRIFDFIESEELPDESGKGSEVPEVNGNVSFENVRFSYPDTPDKVIIKNFSAEVKAGQKVAIVGPTGAGKTTMVNLLMRFFEINSGSISIDGTPISQLSRETVHNMFSMVLQDTWLFEGTVRENLVYNMEGISDESLERVCKACGLDKFVHTLPEGFDTVLSESVAISAGQKQLLTIARAMLQNAPMLILDEATSSVDTRTELLIQRAMDKLTKGRTSFVIAHRLSTIKNADLILVMRDGDVIESGNHETLMAKGGFYAELYNSQFDQAS